MRCTPAGLALLLFLSAPARGVAQDARLEGRLDPVTAVAVRQLADSLAAAGLPVEPLLDKALEGAAKGAPGDRILAALRSVAGRLGAARAALGPAAGEPELVAGADALRAGAAPEALVRLRAGRPDRSVVVPLAALADLVAHGLSPDSASASVLLLVRRGAGDADFAALVQAVGRKAGSERRPQAPVEGGRDRPSRDPGLPGRRVPPPRSPLPTP